MPSWPDSRQGGQGRRGAGRAEGQDAVGIRGGGQRGADLLLGTGRVSQVDREHVDLAAGLGQAVGEALAALIERGVADFLIDAEGVLDTGLAHALTGAEAGLVLGLPDVVERAEILAKHRCRSSS